MTYQEMLENARKTIGPYCRACPVCNGRACGNTVPGPGAKGTGDDAIRNFEAWKNIRVCLDTISENKKPDTTLELFGKSFRYPIFAGSGRSRRSVRFRTCKGEALARNQATSG